ncbi:EF-hand domain-containing protein [Novilysobacter erysipheiresistens]|uniref:EF-hand domain-containing protein n=1 Tax=Novilysobacter erysipheiresistens TaxID=1749332 RepID=A0ABU7YWQ3_9GAMM
MNRRIAARISVLALGVVLAGAALSMPKGDTRGPAATTPATDRDGDRRLERAEHRRHGHHRRHGMARAIRLDTDGDGRVSTIEAKSSRWGEHFADIDRNRDGYLVRSELGAAAEQRRREFAAKRAQRFESKFSSADGNRDGRLSRAEVEANWPHRARAFAFLDEDRDGYLVRADLMPQRRR